MTWSRWLLSIVTLLLLASKEGLASEMVRFSSAAVPPSALKQRLAQERGEIAQPEPADEIAGELYRPEGAGPFPAVVALHGCGGRAMVSEQIIADRFVSWGYVYLAVDSFGPRGIRETCDRRGPAQPVDSEMDAFGAADFLAT